MLFRQLPKLLLLLSIIHNSFQAATTTTAAPTTTVAPTTTAAATTTTATTTAAGPTTTTISTAAPTTTIAGTPIILKSIENLEIQAVFYSLLSSPLNKDGDRLIQFWSIYTTSADSPESSTTIATNSQVSTIKIDLKVYSFFTNILEVTASEYAAIQAKITSNTLEWGDISGYSSVKDFPLHIDSNEVSGVGTAVGYPSLNDTSLTFSFNTVLGAVGLFTVANINFTQDDAGEGNPTSGEDGFYTFSIVSAEMGVMMDNEGNRELSEKMYEQWAEPITRKGWWWVMMSLIIGFSALAVILFAVGCLWPTGGDMKETFSS